MMSEEKFWIVIRAHMQGNTIPNAVGPFESLEDAEQTARTFQPGIHMILGNDGVLKSKVTINAPTPTVERTK